MSGMLRPLRVLQAHIKECNSTQKHFFSQPRRLRYSKATEETLQTRDRKRIGPLGWSLLLIPCSTFALGTWQMQRKKWKENLISELSSRTSSDPVKLPKSLEEIENLEYYPVHVRGRFLHDKEIYLGPRSLIHDGDAATTSSLFSKGQSSAHGYLVVTPFKLADRDQVILVNRGWVPHKRKDPKTRPNGQVEKEIDVVGVVRLHEDRAPFMPANKPEANAWFYRDLVQMCEVTGAEPIFLDATNEFDVEGGPIGGQTRITLRNEHLSYILTWYSLCAISSFMWYSRFIRGVNM